MAVDKDDRKRPQLRLVVDNVEKRKAGPLGGEEPFLAIEELVARREELRPEFYQGLERGYKKFYQTLERCLSGKGWPYGLDPHHGPLIVIPAGVVCPEADEPGEDQKDEILIYITEDTAGEGFCLTMEMILPFYSDETEMMEDLLLFSPVFQYGTLFLEENRQDGLLDFIYRIGFPIFPPALTGRILDRLFTIVAFELKETLLYLADFSEE